MRGLVGQGDLNQKAGEIGRSVEEQDHPQRHVLDEPAAEPAGDHHRGLALDFEESDERLKLRSIEHLLDHRELRGVVQRVVEHAAEENRHELPRRETAEREADHGHRDRREKSPRLAREERGFARGAIDPRAVVRRDGEEHDGRGDGSPQVGGVALGPVHEQPRHGKNRDARTDRAESVGDEQSLHAGVAQEGLHAAARIHPVEKNAAPEKQKRRVRRGARNGGAGFGATVSAGGGNRNWLESGAGGR